MFRRRQPEKTTVLTYSKPAMDVINTFSLQNMLKVSDAVSFVEHKRYREENKINLCFKSTSDLWGMIYKGVWIAYQQSEDDALYIEWVSLLSKFRK